MEDEEFSLYDPTPYIPASLSEVSDLLQGLIGEAPSFLDRSGIYPDQSIDSRYHELTEGFAVVRKKLGEERYAALMDLAGRSKALFADDPEETNGKTMEGIKLIWEMMDIVRSIRARRVKDKLPDEEGEVTGD